MSCGAQLKSILSEEFANVNLECKSLIAANSSAKLIHMLTIRDIGLYQVAWIKHDWTKR